MAEGEEGGGLRVDSHSDSDRRTDDAQSATVSHSYLPLLIHLSAPAFPFPPSDQQSNRRREQWQRISIRRDAGLDDPRNRRQRAQPADT